VSEGVFEARLVAPPPAVPVSIARRVVGRVADLATLAFGFVTLVAVLATLAAIPVVQLVPFGYLLDAEGRVARSGRFRGALPGLRPLARLGGSILGTFLVFLPWVVVQDFWKDAVLIDASSRVAKALGGWTLALGVLATLDAALAIARGGRFGAFFRPLQNVRWAIGRVRQGGCLAAARDRLVTLVRDLELPRTFVLGLKGFLAAGLWLLIPTSLLALGQRIPPVGLLGGLLLALAVVPLPLLQARLAAEGRFAAGFELGAVWRRWRAAPLSAFLALLATLLLALPLYILKVELIPRDARSLAAAVFLLTILPTKLISGKAYARGAGEARASIFLRVPSALVALPAAGVYALFVFLARFIEWRGALALFEQHAFLVPVAFY
jgi:hypothetical protein